jgi:hypothetical protein
VKREHVNENRAAAKARQNQTSKHMTGEEKHMASQRVLCIKVSRMENIRWCIQKFPDWPPGARTTNGVSFCHYVQLYRYFVSQYNEFCRHNPLCCFSTGNTKGERIFRYGLSPKTFGYTLLNMLEATHFHCIRYTSFPLRIYFVTFINKRINSKINRAEVKGEKLHIWTNRERDRIEEG